MVFFGYQKIFVVKVSLILILGSCMIFSIVVSSVFNSLKQRYQILDSVKNVKSCRTAGKELQ